MREGSLMGGVKNVTSALGTSVAARLALESAPRFE